MVTFRAQAGPERAARATWHLHPRPLARPRLRSRRHARGRDSRPALPTPLDAGPGATLVRRGRGAGKAYRDAAHRAFFVEGLNLADEGVLREAAQEAGLDSDEAIVAAWDPERISGLRAMREEAKSIGVHGVPTVATAGRVLYYGAASPGKTRALLTDNKEIAS